MRWLEISSRIVSFSGPSQSLQIKRRYSRSFPSRFRSRLLRYDRAFARLVGLAAATFQSVVWSPRDRMACHFGELGHYLLHFLAEVLPRRLHVGCLVRLEPGLSGPDFFNRVLPPLVGQVRRSLEPDGGSRAPLVCVLREGRHRDAHKAVIREATIFQPYIRSPLSGACDEPVDGAFTVPSHRDELVRASLGRRRVDAPAMVVQHLGLLCLARLLDPVAAEEPSAAEAKS